MQHYLGIDSNTTLAWTCVRLEVQLQGLIRQGTQCWYDACISTIGARSWAIKPSVLVDT